MTGYMVSQQAATENMVRLKSDKARAARVAKEGPGGEYNLNRGEAGVGGLESLDDKYASVSFIGITFCYMVYSNPVLYRRGVTIDHSNQFHS